MNKNDLLAATLQSGVDPVEVRFTPIHNTGSRQLFAYRTVVLLNTQQLGVLRPEEYGPVASRTAQCVKIALSNINEVSYIIDTAIARRRKIDWFSVACPIRMITKGSVSKLVGDLFEDIGFTDPSRLCLEFPSRVLFEDCEMIEKELSALRFMGVKTMVTGFGDDFCPTMRLGGFSFDYAMLDESITPLMDNEPTSKGAMALVAYVKSLGLEAIAVGAVGNDLITKFSQSNTLGYVPDSGALLTLDEALPK